MTEFCVITSVPDPDKGEVGNLATGLDVFRVVRDFDGADEQVERISPLIALSLRTPVFSLGEIIVVNESGREIGGHGRKPSKWSISSEYFDNVEDAIERAKEL